MTGDLKNLYTTVIKAQSESPFHFEKKEHAGVTVKAYNSLCGDRFEIYIDTQGDAIDKLYFYGFGCAISKASTSVLIKSLAGKSLQEARAICDNFLNFMDAKSDGGELTLPDDFRAFSGVHDFPERYDCATLSWKEMKKFLEN